MAEALFAMDSDSPGSDGALALSSSLSPPSRAVRLAATLSERWSLRLVRARVADVSACWQALLRVTLCSRAFVAFAAVGDELSLVRRVRPAPRLTAQLLEESVSLTFPPDALAVDAPALGVIEIREDEAVINCAGYLQRYTSPLAQCGEALLYVSTFRTNLVLVAAAELGCALERLREGVHERPGPARPVPPMAVAALPDKLAIFGAAQLTLTPSLLRDLFLEPAPFVALTSAGDAHTLILPVASLAHWADAEREAWERNAVEWRALHVADGEVDDIARVLGDAGISIFYLSTCHDDYVLVGSHDVDTALRLLAARDETM